METGKQIRKFRSEMHMSQDDLAQRIFVSRQTISNWENDKNYPDIKSLLMLSELFNISLDKLIKGDIDTMKEQIRVTDKEIKKFKSMGRIFTAALTIMIVSAYPLIMLAGIYGILIWMAITAVTISIAFYVERLKKTFDIQTYREIVAFTEGKTLTEQEKSVQKAIRPYQKLLLALGGATAAGLVMAIMEFIFG